MDYYVGIDLGGTNIAVGVVNEEYKIISKYNKPTGAGRTADEICEDMAFSVREAISGVDCTLEDIKWVGIGIPGTINSKSGMISFTNNLGFDGLPIKKIMQEKLGLTVFLENDANAAAYGEALAGAGKNKNHILMLTLGTGVGGAYISDGKIFGGRDNMGGEFGHMGIMVDGRSCTCGRKGCLEAYVSATGLVQSMREAMEIHPESLAWHLVSSLHEVEGKTVFQAMEQNDLVAKRVFEAYIECLSYGIVNYINLFMPETIILGGGISNQGDRLVLPLRSKVKQELYNETTGSTFHELSSCSIKCPQIICAELRNDAGIIGAALLGKE